MCRASGWFRHHFSSLILAVNQSVAHTYVYSHRRSLLKSTSEKDDALLCSCFVSSFFYTIGQAASSTQPCLASPSNFQVGQHWHCSALQCWWVCWQVPHARRVAIVRSPRHRCLYRNKTKPWAPSSVFKHVGACAAFACQDRNIAAS